jgi:hypothetical protein
MTSQSSIVEKTSTLFDETIHITPRCVMHLMTTIGIKMVACMKPFILVDISNGAKSRNYTC